MLGCEEKNLGGGLPPAKFFSNKAIERLFNLLNTFPPKQRMYLVSTVVYLDHQYVKNICEISLQRNQYLGNTCKALHIKRYHQLGT